MNITKDLKPTFTKDNELGFSPIRQYVHDDVGLFSSMCEEALRYKLACEYSKDSSQSTHSHS